MDGHEKSDLNSNRVTSILLIMSIFTFIVVIASCSLSMPSLGTIMSNPNPTPPSPCVEDRDPDYDGIRVNCQHKAISSLPLPAHWIPLETSSLLLDYNTLAYLNKTSFSTFLTWTHLRILGLSHNFISYVEPFTFSKFVSLRALDLESNLISLDQKVLSGHTFDGLVNLSDLKLSDNRNNAHEGKYPTSLLSSLHNLQNLSLDTFMGDLHFCNLFHASTRLSSLVLSGGMTRITNESFDCFSSFNLTTLSIRNCHLYHTETGAFRHLKYLQSYEIDNVDQGPRNTLESLSPFVNKNMSHLNFNVIGHGLKQPRSFARNRIMTVHMVRFLSQICVEHFTMTTSKIFVIDRNVLTSEKWKRCLKTLDLSRNPLIGDFKGLSYTMSQMHRLEVMKIMNCKYSFSHYKGVVWRPPSCPCKVKSSMFDALKTVEGIGARNSESNDNNRSQYKSEIIKTSLSRRPPTSALSHILFRQAKADERRREEFQHLPNLLRFYFPKNLRILILNGVSEYFFRFDDDTQFINADKIEEIHVSDTGSRNFTVSLTGFTNLRILDISRNIGFFMSPAFFNGFSSVVHLNMADMKLDYTFLEEYSSKLISPLTHLSTLDLSRNELRRLSKDTFNANSELRVLVLAGNRFESVPFDLSYVPQLCWLDVSGNAMRALSEPDRTKLDKHADKVPTFSLSLDGNPIHCGCQSLRFLSWLKRTHINLDKQGNYSCTLDSGIRTTTGEMQDLDAMWRKCNGETSLLISLVLLCITISGFFFFIVTFKFKTQLKAFLLRKFWPPFIMKTPADYAIGVYIGYADQDRNLACLGIRQFIEEELGLSTYIRHRDLLPASDMAETIVEAVHSSWRVLFVVSNHFLTDPWSYFALKTSTYAAQVENPGRIVLIMMDGEDHNQALLCQLPTCVLRAAQEQSIVTMTSRGQISYEDKQALVTALLYQGSFFDD